LTTSTTLSLDDALQQALAHHKAGRLPEAEQLYRAILQSNPQHGDANHNLGVLAGQLGQHAGGLPYLKLALTINPGHPQYVLSYANALSMGGAFREALQVVRDAGTRGVDAPALQALREKLENVIAGGSAASQQQPAAATKPAGVSLADLLKGTKAAAKKNKPGGKNKQGQAARPTTGQAPQQDMLVLVDLLNSRRHAELEKQARALLERYPGAAQVWQFLGHALQAQEKDAVAVWQKIIAFFPNDPDAHRNLGIAQARTRQWDDAIASFRRALAIQPDFAEAHNNLGNAFKAIGQSSVAIAHYGRALEISPKYVEAHNNLGIALKSIGQLDNALACYRRAIEIKPDYPEAHGNLGIALTFLGELEQAARSFRRTIELKPDLVEARSSLLYIHNYLSDQPSDMLLDDARRFGDLVARKASPYTAWKTTPDPARRLRVGLVSADLRAHPVGYFVESMLAALTAQESERIEIFAYANHTVQDAVVERIKASCQSWRMVVGLSDEQLAATIHDDAIDILIDLSGHTDQTRLPMFAWKPAPVQASWLGYFATTGVAAVDYFIADPWTAPRAVEAHFTEKIMRLPETYLCFTPPEFDVPVTPLPALENGSITFGCFNNLTKINDGVVALWARVLHAVPGSRLLLKTKQLNGPAVRQNMLDRFARHGIGAERLLLESASPRAALLATYGRIDIALDPFPYPGGTTSVESLWMAVPVISLAGDRFLSHLGESILHNAGLPDWIAADADDYVARAVQHTNDLQKLATLRSGLRQQVLASPLFDAPRFARHFEQTLRTAWADWCRQQQGESA
jgi:predicted O-linked N-acetylglucosamine transferase (SPINDLY family)